MLQNYSISFLAVSKFNWSSFQINGLTAAAFQRIYGHDVWIVVFITLLGANCRSVARWPRRKIWPDAAKTSRGVICHPRVCCAELQSYIRQLISSHTFTHQRRWANAHKHTHFWLGSLSELSEHCILLYICLR